MKTLTENIFQIPFACGCCFILAAALMYLIPPKKINYLYGYRTVGSMKSQERWEFAQKYSTLQMTKSGLFLIAASFVGFAFPNEASLHIGIGLVAILLAAASIFITTESALKKRFSAS